MFRRLVRLTRALRFRIALSYVIFFALLLITLGLLFRQTLKNTFTSQTEQTLNEEWGAVKGYLRQTRTGWDWFFDRFDPEESFIVGRLSRVFLLADAEGHPLQWSEVYTSIGFDSPEYIRSIVRSNTSDVRLRYSPQHVPYMIRSGVMVDEHHHRYYLAIGRNIAENSNILRQFTWDYFALLPLIIAISGLLGWFMAGRALEPVNSVSGTAQRITHSSLDMRIPRRGAGDELDRLIDAFNAMMERLHVSFDQIRQFSTDVSHELRTPLTVIRGQLEVALFTANTADQYREAMVSALEEVERLSAIVRQLLMLSQAESGQVVLQKTEVDLSDIVRNMAEQYQISAEAEGVHLVAEVEPGCVLQADRTQMERLVTNLISNSIKYTPSGGQVRVAVDREDEKVRLVVEDTGVGISPDHLPHIFDRFYRVPSSDPAKGLGLGLSFVAWIVKAHGGSIDVASKPGQGTRFAILFPSAKSGTEAIPEHLNTVRS